MTVRETITHLLLKTNWNIAGIAFVLGVPEESVLQTIRESKIKRRKLDKKLAAKKVQT